MVAVKKPAADGGVPEEELLGVLALVGLIYFTAAGGAYGRSVARLYACLFVRNTRNTHASLLFMTSGVF